jgi:hypothetical protein
MKSEPNHWGLLKQWLAEANIEFVEQSDPPFLTVIFGSAVVFLILDADNEEDAMVLLWAPLVVEAELAPELTEMLLRENARRRFGAFAIDEQNIIAMGHTLLASSLTSDSLLAALGNLAIHGDQMDDLIISRFGGMHASEYYLNKV